MRIINKGMAHASPLSFVPKNNPLIHLNLKFNTNPNYTTIITNKSKNGIFIY